MTINQNNWHPDLSSGTGPKYRAIADAMTRDIKRGVLKAGDRLPPQRDLAWRLGVTVGTVTRAYQEVERQGLVGGEVGRGTYVRPAQDHNLGIGRPVIPMDWYGVEPSEEDEDPNAPIAMQFNFPPGNVGVAALAESLSELSRDPVLPRLLGYQTPYGDPRQLQAAVLWWQKRGFETDIDRQIISSGAHNGILAAMSVLCRPGGRIATERLVYPGLRAIARMLGVDLVPVDIDDEGLVPDALDKVLREGGIDAIYSVPTLQNPTNVTQSEARRENLAEVIRRYDAILVEDDLFGLLKEEAPPPLSRWLREQAICITSLSKSVAPGLRVGFVDAPDRLRESVAAAVRSSTWMAPPLTVEIATRWIHDGTAESIMMQRRAVDEIRRVAALEALHGLDADLPPGALHAWLHLPDPWHASQFVATAKDRGVILSAAHAFSIGRERPPFAVRVCLGPASSTVRMERGLTILRAILEEEDPFRDQAVM